MKSFGVSESLILAGSAIIIGNLVTEGWVVFSLGVLSGFIRFTTWFGMQQDNLKKD